MNEHATKEQLETYGIRLKNRRIDRVMTLEELAVLVGSTKQTLSNIESAKYKSYNKKLLNNLASQLCCTTDYLLGLSDDPSATADAIPSRIPWEYAYPAVPLKNRLFELCGNDTALLDMIVSFMENATPAQKIVFKNFMKSFSKFADKERKQQQTEIVSN